LAGFDTRTPQRSFGNGSSAGFGDKKGLDLWTFYPSQAALTTVDIFPLNLAIAKSDGGVAARPGQTVVYTLTYSNTSQVEATGVVVTETVPLHTRFSQTASSPTLWACPDNSPAGAICTTALGAVAGGAGGQLWFAVTLDDPLPAGVTQIENVAVIGDDLSHGDEPTGDNSAPEDTPIPPPSDDGDDGGDDDDGDDDGGGDDGGPPDEDGGDSDDGDDSDDDDGGGPPAGGGEPAPGLQALAGPGAAAPAATATPVLPVILLPETGAAGLEGWKVGKLESWKVRRLEGCKVARLQGFDSWAGCEERVNIANSPNPLNSLNFLVLLLLTGAVLGWRLVSRK
jgi:uncharacterized repeat protein (TIGR01451 family)